MNYDNPELQDRLAAEYVLGTLRGRARRRFESLLASRPALRQAVGDWEARLLPLAASLAPEEPPPRVWQRIERQLFRAESAEQAGQGGGWFGRLWASAGVWRTVAAGSVIVALLLGYSALRMQPPLPGAAQIALLQDDKGQPAVLMQFSPGAAGADTVEVSLTPLQRPAAQSTHSHELWAIAPGGVPRSLGLLPPAIGGRMKVPVALLASADLTLAVSVEPVGGSPTGGPTGPVILQGKLRTY